MKKLLIVAGLATAMAVIFAFTRTPDADAGPHYYHVIMLKRKKDMPAAGLERLDKLWQGMVSRMDGFISHARHDIECAEFDHAVVLEFSNLESFQRYQKDQTHQQIVAAGPSLIDRVLVYSYWK